MIIIHIGTHKTGTTSIQNFLSSNRDEIFSEGFMYSSISNNHSGPLASIFKDNPFNFFYYKKHLDFRPTDIIGVNRKNIKKITSEINENKDKKIVYSGEELSFLTFSEVKRMQLFFSQFDDVVKIIIYKRDFFDYFISAFKQHIKGGCYYDLIERNPPEYIFQKSLDIYKRVFGEANVAVRDYKYAKDNIINDFLLTIGCKIESAEQRKDNVSFGKYACFTFNALNFLGKKCPLKDSAFKKVKDKKMLFEKSWLKIFNAPIIENIEDYIEKDDANWKVTLELSEGIINFMMNEVSENNIYSLLIENGNSVNFSKNYINYLQDLKNVK